MATVITIPGAFSTYNTGNFGGALFTSPNVHVNVPLGGGGWNNWTLTDAAATSDMNKLNDLIAFHIDSVPGERLIVAGHSRGGQIIYKWLREMAPSSTFDPAKILFISSGNPERKYGGASVYDWSGHKPVYPGTQPYGSGYGLPVVPTTYTVFDIARQYDEWADHPQDLNNTSAHALTVAADVHSAYQAIPALGRDGLPVNWGQWSIHAEGTVTYLMCAYFPHPSTPPQPAYSFTAQIYAPAKREADKQHGYRDLLARANDEAGFRRPFEVVLPAPYTQ